MYTPPSSQPNLILTYYSIRKILITIVHSARKMYFPVQCFHKQQNSYFISANCTSFDRSKFFVLQKIRRNFLVCKTKKEGVFQRLHFLLDCSCHSKHTHARFHNPLACCRILCINRCRNCNLSRYRFKHTCRFCIRIVYIFRPYCVIKCHSQT